MFLLRGWSRVWVGGWHHVNVWVGRIAQNYSKEDDDGQRDHVDAGRLLCEGEENIGYIEVSTSRHQKNSLEHF